MQPESVLKNEVSRGVFIAVALAMLLLGVFALFVHGGTWRSFIPSRKSLGITAISAPGIGASHAAAPKPQPAPRPKAEANDEFPAAPLGYRKQKPGDAMADAAGADAGGATGSLGPAGGAAGGGGGLSPAGSALRDALSTFKNNPSRTATISITSTGRVVPGGSSDLTVYDGVPASALSDGVLMTGSPGPGR